MAAWPTMPCLFCGDVNAEPSSIRAIQERLANDSLVDVGMRASAWGGIDGSPTARAHRSTTATRTDAILANVAALSIITGFRVGDF
eukprot:1372992-Alexandrium_andersonii.AAC.1